jgi:hypothetical protein
LRYCLGLESWETYVQEGWIFGESILRAYRLADYIAKRTDPSDRVYYWSGDVQFYYVADRRAATDIIWPINLEATGPYDRIFSPQTAYVIVGTSYSVPRPDWMYVELEAHHYALVKEIDGQQVYARVE